MTFSRAVAVAIALSALSAQAWAKGASSSHSDEPRIDISNGVAFPGTNTAIWDNPAALGAYSADIIDAALIYTSPNFAGLPSYSGGHNPIGFGFGVKVDPANGTEVRGGFGYNFGPVQIGVADTFSSSSFYNSLDLGLRFRKGPLALGIIMQSFTSFYGSWLVGVGVMPLHFLLIEVDAKLSSTHFTMDLYPSVSVLIGSLFTAEVGIPVSVLPSPYVGIPQFGASLWPFRVLGFYILLGGPEGTFQGGVKIQVAGS